MSRDISLDELQKGELAAVKTLLHEGRMHRRLLDMGLAPGRRIECLGKSAAGDPLLYRVRGAVLAIRRVDGRKIVMEREEAKNGGDEREN